MINDVMASGALAIQNGVKKIDASANEIARANVQQSATTSEAAVGGRSVSDRPVAQPSTAESLMAQSQGLYEVQAGVRVVETADQSIGTLIEERV